MQSGMWDTRKYDTRGRIKQDKQSKVRIKNNNPLNTGHDNVIKWKRFPCY